MNDLQKQRVFRARIAMTEIENALNEAAKEELIWPEEYLNAIQQFEPVAEALASELSEFVDKERRNRKLTRVVSYPDVLGGVPCVSGTRVPAVAILTLVRAGVPHEDIIYEYKLPIDAVDASLQWEKTGCVIDNNPPDPELITIRQAGNIMRVNLNDLNFKQVTDIMRISLQEILLHKKSENISTGDSLVKTAVVREWIASNPKCNEEEDLE